MYIYKTGCNNTRRVVTAALKTGWFGFYLKINLNEAAAAARCGGGMIRMVIKSKSSASKRCRMKTFVALPCSAFIFAFPIIKLPLGHLGPRPAFRLLKNTSNIENSLCIRFAFNDEGSVPAADAAAAAEWCKTPLSIKLLWWWWWAFSFVCTARYWLKNFNSSRILSAKNFQSQFAIKNNILHFLYGLRALNTMLNQYL